MKKNLLFLLALISLCENTSAQSFEWAKRAGLYAFDLGYGVGNDNAGNVYIAGKYELNAYFGGTYVSCAGNHDIYIAKYNSSGAFQWVRTAGGAGGDYAHALTVDGAGNSYVTGEMEMTTRFGSVSLTTNGSNDVFVAKYDTNGNLVWAKKLGGGKGSDKGLGISVSGGNVYVTGNFQGGANFAGTSLNSSGGHDIFIAKYTTGGVLQWVKKAGGSGEDEGFGISSDPSGNIYVTGYFTGTANFSGTSLTSNGGTDIFVAKYNSGGNLIWVKKAGAGANDAGNAIKVDNAGRIFVTGGFRYTTNFGSFALKASGGNSDLFVARYDSSGNVIWAKSAGGWDNDSGRGIAVDGNSNTFITGNCGQTATFGPTTLYGADITELFFASYDVSGNFRWVLKAGGETDVSDPGRFIEMGLSISTDPSGNVFASGAYRSSSSFGGTTLAPWSTHTQVFLTKIRQSGSTNTNAPSVNITSPSNNSTFSGPANITINASASSNGGSGISKVEFFQGNTKIGEDASSPYSYTWTNVSTGNYSLKAVATNNSGQSATSQIVNVSVNTSSPPSNCSSTGTITRDVWTNFNGTSISSIPVNSTPSGTSQLSRFEGPSQAGDHYASRIRGYICPPITGSYVFWIASDNNSELWLSTNSQPSNKIKIATVPGYTSSRQWTKYTQQKSASINLTAGEKYYIEALHREGTQGDNLAVGWQLPNGTLERPITGNRLSPYSSSTSGGGGDGGGGNVCSSPIITPLGPTRFCSGSVTLITKTGSGYSYQWKKNGSDISGATGSSYTVTSSGDYQVKVIQGSCIAWSAPMDVRIDNTIRATITPGGSTTFCNGGSVKLYGNTCSGNSYQWKKNGANIPGATGSTYTATSAGNYQLQVTRNSTNAWSSQVTVTVNNCSIEEDHFNEEEQEEPDPISVISETIELEKTFQMKVFPNPNTGLFTLELNMPNLPEQIEEVKVEMINTMGQPVYTKLIPFNNGYINEQIELESSVITGIYFLQVTIGEKVEKTRVMLSK